jgi:hypothetical protein
MGFNSAKRMMTGAILGLLLVPAAYAAENGSHLTDGGSGVGSGGDYIRELFEQARTAAVAKVNSVLPCAIPNGTSPDIANWINANRTAIANDIAASPHLWVVDTQTTCAYTDHSAGSALYLSYPTCNSTTNTLNAAMFVVMHETAHHLGVADEKVADAVAAALMNASVVKECPSAGTPFDPTICQGAEFSASDATRYLPQGANSVSIGAYGFYTRARFCTVVSGCQEWKSVALYREKPVPTSFQIVVSTVNVSPYFVLSFFPVETGLIFSWAPDMKNITFYSNHVPNSVGNVTDPKTTIPLDGGQQVFAGAVRSNCSWYHYSQSTPLSGGRQETEVIVYGRH